MVEIILTNKWKETHTEKGAASSAKTYIFTGPLSPYWFENNYSLEAQKI
jgi:hypothetical protein